MALKFEGIEFNGGTMLWKLDTRGNSIRNQLVLVKNLEIGKGLCPFDVSLKGESMVKYMKKVAEKLSS